jgi:hypothetical protein
MGKRGTGYNIGAHGSTGSRGGGGRAAPRYAAGQ